MVLTEDHHSIRLSQQVLLMIGHGYRNRICGRAHSSTNNWYCGNDDIDALFFEGADTRSIDVETKVLNDLGEKVHTMGEMLIEKPTLGRVITNTQADRWSEELPFPYYIL